MVEKKTRTGIRRKEELKAENETAKRECRDKNCPFHAGLSLRGRSFAGELTRKRGKTVKVEWLRYKYFPKYERYAKVRSGVFAHLPECLSDKIQVGDRVKIKECRPISKTKHFVVLGKIRE
ncbi:30S ribosomal protein S17 [Candidatus Pacearchaeota archaeon ex4484_26]|nr:MAG: 30S ribosomal protein S17 [Candidatus Pacearchaeota archaeon ex4484_26]